MMKVPAFQHKQFPTGETVTIFQDDAEFNRFYLIPGFPTVRTDPNGNPVFQLIKYNLSDQSREQDPSLPRGGGYMVFDSELKVKAEHQEEIEEDLKDYVRQRWEAMKREPNQKVRTLTLGASFNDTIGDHWRQPGMEGTPRANPTTGSNTTLTMPGTGDAPPPMDAPAPPVVLGEPLYKAGKVTMNAPQSAALVSGKIGERPASLIGNNVAAFSIDLTPDGASFMEQTLVGRDGRGATDLTPIQVVYELTVAAKLPPAKMLVKFNTASVYHSLHELFHEHQNCSDDYFTSETSLSSAIEAGLVTVKIDAGGANQEVVQMLTQQAMSTVQQLLTDRFAAKEKAKPDDWGTDDIAKDSAEVYRLKRETEVDMTDFQQEMEISTNFDLKIAPQGTLQAFFTKAQDMKRFVRVVNANDPFFMTLGLKARAFAKWQEDSIAFVELEVKYGKGAEFKTQSFTFTPDKSEPQSWDPSLIDAKREFQFRWRVGFQGRSPGDWTGWQTSTTRNLNVAVETPGKLEVEVSGVGLDFENVLDAVLVHLSYSDPGRDVPLAGQSILMAKDRAGGKWTRQLFAPWDKGVDYRIEYLLKSGTVIEKNGLKTAGPTQALLIPRPDVDVLNLTLVPAGGGWKELVQAVASLRYTDGSYARDAQFNFTKPEEFRSWAVLLLNKSQRKFEYRLLATFKNGDSQETGWLSREGDQAVPLMVEGPPRLDLRVIAPGHDFLLTPLVKVDLRYDDQGQQELESVSLQSKDDVKTWSIPVRKDGPRSYHYKITYYPSSSAPVERDWLESTDELLAVPRYAIPKVGTDVLPTLQDFTLTPAVEVNLAYDDPQSNLHERATLVFTSRDKQSWFLPVADTASRSYSMQVTWYFADGHDVASPALTLDKPSVVLPRAPRDAQA